jgi:preprotein translocase subunit SecF
MRFIKPNVNINFIGIRHIAYLVSGLMILAGLVSMVIHKGPRYGIDFTGGTLIQVKFQSEVKIDDIKTGLTKLNFGSASVQTIGELGTPEYLIRTEISKETGDNFTEKLQKILSEATGKTAEIRRVEMVGPQVGKDLQQKAFLAIYYSLLLIAIYISGRFEFKWMVSAAMAGALFGLVYFLSVFSVSMAIITGIALAITLALFWFLRLQYAMGAIVALIHDVSITVGLFSIFNKEITLPIVAAILTIIGFSLNDTIIVFDRIRENQKKLSRLSFESMINKSINETLSRTILTSGTVLITVVALFFLGGDIIHDFAFAMIAGVVVGTYSSIYIASPILLIFSNREKS